MSAERSSIVLNDFEEDLAELVLVREPPGVAVDIRILEPITQASPNDDRDIREHRFDDRAVRPFFS